MKKIISVLAFYFLSLINAQSLTKTRLIETPNSADNFREGYTFARVASGTPWHGSLISFGGFESNYDTQINASYFSNNLSFRTRNGDYHDGVGLWNSWNEVWHSGNLNNSDSDFKAKVVSANLLVSSISSSEGGVLSLFNNSKTGSTVNDWRIYNMTGSYGNSLQFWSYSQDNTANGPRLKLADNGNMALYGKLEATEVKVTTSPTADFVFEEDYKLPRLEEVEEHIKTKKHLPEIASAKEMEKEGVNIGEFQIQLLQKIEELTLYSIEQNKQLKQQNESILKQQIEIKDLKTKMESLKNLK